MITPVARTRNKERSVANGVVLYNKVIWPQPSYVDYYKRIDDVIHKTKRPDGTTPPSSLYIYERTVYGGILNSSESWLEKSDFTDIRGCMTAISGLNGHGEPPDGGWTAMEGTSEELTVKLLKDTNPFRYSVSVPVMITELIEAASLLNIIKSSIIGSLGTAAVVEQWGINPMISDLKSLAKITEAIERRVKEFNSLIQKGGLRRKVELASKTKTYGSTSNFPIFSGYQKYFEGRSLTTYRTKVWGTVRWKPNRDSPVDLKDLANFNEAAKILFDLRTPDVSTIWEAIPWSWLADYFLNVGDTLKALEDTDKVIPTDVCIMRERWVESETRLVNVPSNNSTTGNWIRRTHYENGVTKHHYQLREVRNPSDLGDLLHFGIMSEKQATNLMWLLLSFRGHSIIR